MEQSQTKKFPMYFDGNFIGYVNLSNHLIKSGQFTPLETLMADTGVKEFIASGRVTVDCEPIGENKSLDDALANAEL